MKSRIIRYVFLAVVLFFGTQCYYDNELELYPTLNGNCNTDSLSYQEDILPILEDNCITCHDATAASGGIILDSHSDLVSVVNSGSLEGAITHNPSYSPMPKGRNKLSDCQIRKISFWIAQGAQNN